jgi:hypothetical protein
MSPLLIRVKALIWAQSLTGALLMAGYFAALANGPDTRVAGGIIACVLVWISALRPLGRQASRLQPEDLRPPTGLPGWLLALCAVVQVGGIALGRTEHDGLIASGYAVALMTLLARESISFAMEIPIHGRTWGICMLLVGFGLVRTLAGWFLAIVFIV